MPKVKGMKGKKGSVKQVKKGGKKVTVVKKKKKGY